MAPQKTQLDGPGRAGGPGEPPVRRGRMARAALTCMLLGVVAVWGWTFALMKDAIAEFGVVSFLAVRFAIAAAALLPFTAGRLTGGGLRVGGRIGVVLAAAYLLQTFGLRHTTATNTGLITGLFIVFAPLAGRTLYGVRTAGALWGAVGVSVLGLALLSGAGASGPTAGDALTLGGAACFGLHIALLDRHAKRHDPAVLAQGQIALAAALFLAAWPFVERPAWPTPSVWFALLVTGVVATALAFFVQTFVQRRLTAVETASIIILEPVFAAVFGHLLAGDRLTPLQLLGAALMVGSLAAVEVYPAWSARRARRRGGAAGAA
jgi:drug/metabolite transporter (DMT)-like permease